MSNTIIAVLIFLLMFVVYWMFKFFQAPMLNDFLTGFLTSTLWVWLPFRACGRLVKEWRKKHSK